MLGTADLMAFVPVTDKDRARAFYEQTLGLRFVKDDGFALIFDANGTAVRVVSVRELTPFPFTILGWQVADIEATVRELGARGVTFERYGFFEQDPLAIWTAPSGDKVAWFKDPSGNTLSVSQHV